jgi:MFS family permease
MLRFLPSLRKKQDVSPDEQVLRRNESRRPMRTEAGGFGMMLNIHGSMINPLLLERGAGSLTLGVYNSLASLALYSSGFLGPRAAYAIGNVGETILTILIIFRLILIALTALLWIVPDGAVVPILVLALLWTMGEGLVLPLWTAFIAGLVPPSLRGRWLALRGVASALSAAGVLIALLIVMQFTSREAAIPFAYTVATMAGVLSLYQIRTLLHINPQPAPAKPQSLRSIPAGREKRRFLGGVFTFWFGAAMMGPLLVPYIMNELNGPTAYFAASAAVGTIAVAFSQRRWGRYVDQNGARATGFYAGLGVTAIPLFWIFAPFYWLGLFFELIASYSWPGHSMSLTMRSIEFAETEEERPTLLAWTSMAQGAGAFVSPLVASVLVGFTGYIPLFIASGVFRLVGTIILSEAERENWFRGLSPFRRRRRTPVPNPMPPLV